MSRSVLLAGMFDMQNYGDLLFPLVARHALAGHGLAPVPMAPTAGPTLLGDALPPVALGDVLAGAVPADAIAVGGGYIIHAQNLDFIEDYDSQGTGAWAGPGLWLGATLAASLRDIPIAWNAPGVPHPFTTAQRTLVQAACRAAGHLAVRDRGSADLLGAPEDAPACVVPDPVAGIAAMWPRATLAPLFGELLARKGLPAQARLLAIHVRNRSMAGLDPAALGAALGRLARAHGAVPMLVAVGQSHDDPKVARLLAPHIGAPVLLLDDPRGLREITAALAFSAAYVGASLHGYVVAGAYGVPGVLLGRPAYRKFAGFLEHVGRPEDLARDWDGAIALAAARLGQPRHAGMPHAVLAALDRHWAALAAALADPAPRRAARQAFLGAVVAHGLAREGPGWALRPFVNRAMRAAGGASSGARHHG
jgi:polysaccharide pyruvyl transferase WcaK-like protein